MIARAIVTSVPKYLEGLDGRATADGVLNSRLLHEVTSTDGGGKGLMGLPLGGGSGSGLLHHLINLLERQTLGLGDEEVAVDEGACAETSPDEKDGRLEVSSVLSDHVRSNNCKSSQKTLFKA